MRSLEERRSSPHSRFQQQPSIQPLQFLWTDGPENWVEREIVIKLHVRFKIHHIQAQPRIGQGCCKSVVVDAGWSGLDLARIIVLTHFQERLAILCCLIREEVGEVLIKGFSSIQLRFTTIRSEL